MGPRWKPARSTTSLPPRDEILQRPGHVQACEKEVYKAFKSQAFKRPLGILLKDFYMPFKGLLKVF